MCIAIALVDLIKVPIFYSTNKPSHKHNFNQLCENKNYCLNTPNCKNCLLYFPFPFFPFFFFEIAPVPCCWLELSLCEDLL